MSRQAQLFCRDDAVVAPDLIVSADIRAIEDPLFPFEHVSKIAEQESWRKEVNRPTYHIHKWWAQRLGSVFRALVLGTFSRRGTDTIDLFYRPSRIGDVTVFDPFMGSGTTLGEVVKLGGRAFGQDINPVAYFLVKNALNLPHREEAIATFQQIEADTAHRILEFYTAKLPDGKTGHTLYYFWVKVINCLHCEQPTDLFSSYVFAQHAYPSRSSDVQILCPACSAIYCGSFGEHHSECPQCGFKFDPSVGPARGSEALCGRCKQTFPIAKSVRKSGTPPKHRLYAKLVLGGDGQKLYLPADDSDHALYGNAVRQLCDRQNAFPVVPIKPGFNTKQVLNYSYSSWHEMFNARQLLCLSILADKIRAIPNQRLKELFCCLFSGTLEFNNMFASYKGEGTGAVRHMFSHHVLKPERTPIEANVWGTPKSSGSFSTLFKSRLLRAIDYAENPFEIRPEGTRAKKVFDLSKPLTFDPDCDSDNERLRLQCGDSSKTSLQDETVDAVITDPPFFNNVHYSELADFFFVWQRHILGENGFHLNDTTRANEEVQHVDSGVFEKRLTGVWSECRRVLKSDGLLVFTFHHSRVEGWCSLLGSIVNGGFHVVAVHPIRSEMTGATPKHQAKEPIGFDAVFVCRKAEETKAVDLSTVPWNAEIAAKSQLHRLTQAGFNVSVNDIRLLVLSHAIRLLSIDGPTTATAGLKRIERELEEAAMNLSKSRTEPLTQTNFPATPLGKE